MSKRHPRTLTHFWNEQADAQGAWQEFIGLWVLDHAGEWELAELHWLSYVEEFVRYRRFEKLAGSRLMRRAEGAAQAFLASHLAGSLRCKYCEKMSSSIEVSNK